MSGTTPFKSSIGIPGPLQIKVMPHEQSKNDKRKKERNYDVLQAGGVYFHRPFFLGGGGRILLQRHQFL